MRRYLGPIAAALVVGCYGGNHVELELGANPACGPDSPTVLFFAFTRAYQPARGLARFPDGGSPRRLLATVSLYQLDRRSGALSRLHDFGDLPHASRSVWDTEVGRAGREVRFRITPVGGWGAAMANRPLITAELRGRLHDWFVLDTESGALSRPAGVEPAGAPRPRCSLDEVRRLTRDVSWKAWGVDLDRVFPASREARIRDLEELRGNQAYREAVIERLEGELDAAAIGRIIEAIEANARRQSAHARMASAGPRSDTLARLRSSRRAAK
jgi:hypothetical protein